MILVVGGHSRNIGKTSVVANLIRALSECSWTAIKITQFGHGVCAATGVDCGCAIDPDHPFALTRERKSDSGTDTARYLAAGARESWWLRTRAGELGFAMPALRGLLDRADGNGVLIESNSVMQFLRPDAYIVVVDPGNADFKPSSRLFLDRADALLWSGAAFAPNWNGVSPRLLAGPPSFRLEENYEPTGDFLDFIRRHHKVLEAVRR